MATIDVIGGTWKPVILPMRMTRTMRFGELRKPIPRVSPKVLTQHLRELEADGLVHRTVHPEVPPRVSYALSERGDTLGPIVASIYEWGERHR